MAAVQLSTELTALLNANGVHDDIRKFFITKTILTLKNFANYVDEKKELKDAITEQIQSMKGDTTELSKLKMAWREAETIVARGLKRSSEGISDESLDEPLHHDVQKSLEK